jgi:maltose O-acetyltransferase
MSSGRRLSMAKPEKIRKTVLRVLNLRQKLNGEVDMNFLIERGLTVGKNVYIAPWSIIDPGCAFMITIGDGVVFGPRVHVLAHDASMRKHIGMTRFAPVTIESNVFIGADTLVLPGTTIGERSIVGAASVVSRDIPPGVLAYGNPARVAGPVDDYLQRLRKRMDEMPHFTVADRNTPSRWQFIRDTVGEGEGWWP